MRIAVEDPLIAGMAIRCRLPIHESSSRLRKLTPESPRVHGVAVMADVSRRRWWPLDSAVATGRLGAMFDRFLEQVQRLGDGEAAVLATAVGEVRPAVAS